MGGILIVDDAKIMRDKLKLLLKRSGYNVCGEAASIKEAIEVYKKTKPTLVTMDISLPEIDGIKGVQLLKQIDPNAKIIMVSALDQKDMILLALKSGAINFIVKPFKEETVLSIINDILKK
jgi:two-component system, chemotaxis family, chemotaxis protein CheY